MSKANDKPALVAVTLQTQHTHQGVDYPAGATISVNALDKAWLEQHKIIAAPAADTKRGDA